MFGGLAAALMPFDRLCAQFATAVHGAEPQIYSAIFVTALLWVLIFPPKNDSDQA